MRANTDVSRTISALDPKLRRWARENIISSNGNLRSEQKLVDAFANADSDIKANPKFANLRKVVLSQALYFNRDRDTKVKPKDVAKTNIQLAAEKDVESISPTDPCNPERIEKYVLRLPADQQEAERKRLIAKYCGEQPEEETGWDTFKRVMTTDISDLTANYKANRARRLGNI